ncbi:efflux RND transporter periplasmic adaptor subunit [Bradyrhizobium ontarionense]|uniref:Efflux RND transporter periplasmic adaptor subunit n=1 Tax=Bradyrhizobium ontarionense TaxID=2898149 RepID=A0ABY3RCH8_9BRAD|nr:efflux RND transporter periplasmic adaptor subunit [Bradyrhizobium sp. A19]UFZ04763.1 efflux RND transporter periplasmic adaptor subunit [Bradyrhizobium sp. A19]
MGGGDQSRAKRSGFARRLAIAIVVAAAAAAILYVETAVPTLPRTAADWLMAQWRPAVEDPAPPRPAVQVKVVAVRREDMPIFLNSIGNVQAYNAVNVQSRVDGEITQILFQEGQKVEQGDALAIIDPRPLKAQLDQQLAILQKDEALLAGAELDLDRYETLSKTSAVSRQQLEQQRALVDQYRAQIKNDHAQIDYARTQLGFTTIRAPLSGRIGIRQVDQGNFVRASAPSTIATITQLQPISVIFTVSAAALSQTQLVPGQAKAPVSAYDQDNVTELDKGSIELVDNQVDPATGTIKLKASFPNAAQKLWPGNFVNGRITLDIRRDGVTVPAVAVRHGTLGDFVWLVRPDQTVAVRGVGVAQIHDGRALISRGLARADQVVVEGFFRLEPGAKIEIIEDGPAPANPPANKPPPAKKQTSSATERG